LPEAPLGPSRQGFLPIGKADKSGIEKLEDGSGGSFSSVGFDFGL